ncbi:MAG: hypothetical protein PHS19_03810 [Eubacteriales bacterium]|nr:hypothetical protein [Eubacteriales bacterium]
MTDELYFKICTTVNVIIIVIALALAAVSWSVLPDQVLSTFGNKEGAETLSKLEAIGIPLILVGVGELIYFSKRDFRAVLVSGLGIAGFILNFICN